MLSKKKQGRQRLFARRARLSGPALSIILIVYDMPAQAQRTVRSLLHGYQRDVASWDYELLIIENASANTLPRSFVDSLPPYCSYLLRDESRPTPVPAINEGLRLARGRNLCVMIDGARLVTPGVVKNLIRGHQISDQAVVTVPGYHLGKELQQVAVGSGYSTELEDELVASIAWPEDGYRLFEIACFSGSCAHGFFLPHSESNCISLPRKMWHELGGFDERFDLRGGGLVNLDTYKRACEHPGAQHVFLHGEGTFHQFHGGVTTGGEDSHVRQRYIDESMQQYADLRGASYESPQTDPVYLGELSDYVQQFVFLSTQKKLDRMRMMESNR